MVVAAPTTQPPEAGELGRARRTKARVSRSKSRVRPVSGRLRAPSRLVEVPQDPPRARLHRPVAARTTEPVLRAAAASREEEAR